MTPALLRAVVFLVPAALLVGWSAFVFLKTKGLGSALQLLGAISLLIVVATHVAEALAVLPAMGWGEENSAGHYLDLTSALLGIVLVPLGYIIRIRTRRPR